MQNREFLKTLKVGDKLFTPGGGKGYILNVTKVGRKYFYCSCIHIGSDGYKIDLKTGHTVHEYGSSVSIYESEQAWLDSKSRFNMHRTIKEFFERSAYSDNLTTEQLQTIIGVLNDR